MLRKILVPLDGSDLAEHALTDATALAVPTAATLILVRAVIVHTVPGTDPITPQVETLAEAARYLDEVAAALRGRGFTCETATPYGNAADWIPEEALARQADLIVMSTHGRTGPGRWIFGSVAESVLARTTVPVLVVRAWRPQQGELLLHGQPRLVVPLDGSVFAESALAVGAGLAEDIGAELVLTRVEPDPKAVLTDSDGRVLAYVDQEEAALYSTAMDYLGGVVAELAKRWPSVPVRTRARFGDPVAGIAATAVETDAALIVMATHGRTGLSRAVLGSIAGRILEHGSIPLVLVHPPEHAARATDEERKHRAAV